MDRIYLPDNLDIDQLIKEYPPYFKPFRKDKLAYFINFVTVVPYVKNKHAKSNYIPLSSSQLSEVAHN